MSPPTATPFMSTWTLKDALELHNLLLPIARTVGFGLGLTGGVLRNGRSDHDVDVIFYPLQAPEGNIDELKGALKAFGMRPYKDRAQLTAGWRASGSADEKHVEVWEHDGKRVDVFFLR